MGEQTLEPLLTEESMRLHSYQGLERTIGLYMPTEHTSNVIQGLNILKEHATDHYRLFEGHVRTIRATDKSDRAAVANPVIYLSTRTIRKGRMYCAVTIVHEAKHRQLLDSRDISCDHEDICIEEEASVLEQLGDVYWREMKMGFPFSRKAYRGLRLLNRTFLK